MSDDSQRNAYLYQIAQTLAAIQRELASIRVAIQNKR